MTIATATTAIDTSASTAVAAIIAVVVGAESRIEERSCRSALTTETKAVQPPEGFKIRRIRRIFGLDRRKLLGRGTRKE